MAITKYHNITGSTGVTVQLIAPGSKVNSLGSILVTNIHNTAAATVSLFIEDSPTASASKTFTIVNKVILPAGTALLLDEPSILDFDNLSSTSFGLYITVGSSDTVDVTLGL